MKKNTKQEEMHTREDSSRKDFEQYDDLLFLISALLPRTTIGVTQNDIIIKKDRVQQVSLFPGLLSRTVIQIWYEHSIEGEAP